MGETKGSERLLGRSAAVLLFLGLLTGLYAGAAMTGRLRVNAAAALASHLNALMGAFLMVSLGWTLPMLRYGEPGRRRLALVFIVSSYANWLVTAVKAALGVGGIDFVGSAANRTVFVALQVGVVLPTIGGAIAWALGFGPRRQPGQGVTHVES